VLELASASGVTMQLFFVFMAGLSMGVVMAVRSQKEIERGKEVLRTAGLDERSASEWSAMCRAWDFENRLKFATRALEEIALLDSAAAVKAAATLQTLKALDLEAA
jgi:hypothetical protein